MKVLVAGVTGQLGHGVVEAADAAGVELVPLARPSGRRGAAERVARAFGAGPLSARSLDGDVTERLWGLADMAVRELADEVDAVLDLAAEVDWTAGDARLSGTNVLGAVNGLELARRLHSAGGRCRLFCLAGSVYVAGRGAGRVPERRFGADGGRTRYEQSKWQGEEEVLCARRDGGPAVLVARVGGLVGSSTTGATVRRNSLYLLADEWNRLPGGVLPAFGPGRVDMLPRDVAASLLLRSLRAALERGEDAPEIVHVCAGEHAPRTDAVVEVARSLDAGERLRAPRRIPLPGRALTWLSENGERFADLPRQRGNALVGLRYLAIDRTFERDRLADLVGDDLPAPSAEQIARLAFDVGPLPLQPASRSALARYAA